MMSFIRRHLILTVFFSLLSVCLFLGDGQQMIIDTVGTAGVLILILVAYIYGKKERELPVASALLWGGLLFYYSLRTVFSDDIGYSVYTTIRMADAFLVFYIFTCYLNDNDRRVFPNYIVGFCVFALVAAALYTLVPALAGTLPKTNLLVPNYGHNHVVDILVFAIPIAFFGAVYSKKFWYLLILIVLLFGVAFSFARAAMVLVGIFLLVATLVSWKRISSRKRIAIGAVVAVVGILFSLFFIVPRSVYQQYLHVAAIPKMEKQPIGSEGRLEYFRQTIEAIKERPIFGSGPGTFILTSKRLQKASLNYSRYAHNVLLEEWSTAGLVGAGFWICLVFWSGWHIYTRRRSVELRERFSYTALSASCLLTLCYAFLDFTMSFWVILILFWAVIGVLLSFNEKTQLRSSASRYIYRFFIAVLIVWYGLQLLCLSGWDSKKGLLAYVYFLGEGPTTDFLEKNSQVEKNTQDMLLLLHKKNSNVLSLLGSHYMRQVLSLDPKNFSLHKQYIQMLIDNKEWEETGFALSRFIISFTNRKEQISIEKQIQDIDFTHPLMREAFLAVNMDVLDEAIGVNVALARYLYLLGYELLPKDIHLTIKLWTLAASLAPEWSYFPVELASLYYRYGDYMKALDVVTACQQDERVNTHCAYVSFSNLSEPGFFRNDILQIPQKGTLVAKQTAFDNSDQRRTLDILTSYMQTHDMKSAGAIVGRMTTRFLPEQERNMIEHIDFSDPMIADSLQAAFSFLQRGPLHIDDRLFLAKLYYFIGYSVLDTKPAMTENFWNLSLHLAPEWSYFPVELASLYTRQHNYVKAKETLETCQQHTETKAHCGSFAGFVMPNPGVFQNYILAIP